MSSNVYVVSDTHFGHRNIIEFESELRPFKTIEEHDEELVRRWNETVGKKDVVYHLGDVYFGQKGHVILRRLNGLKKLVLGNHDHYSLHVYQQYFSKIYGAFQYSNAILTHVPVHPNQLERRYKMNIHGHMHSKKMDDPRYQCVSIEHTDLRPVLMNEVLARVAELPDEPRS